MPGQRPAAPAASGGEQRPADASRDPAGPVAGAPFEQRAERFIAPPAERVTERWARLAYGSLLRLLTPAYLLRLWWRGRREPGYRQHLAERLALGLAPQAPGALWIHAVSLGETRAATALVAELRAARPGWPLLLTHGTATGRAAGAALLQPGDRQRWLPFDTPGAVARFLRAERPAVGVLMETEIWPSLLHAAAAAGLPMVLANARLSERSARRGERLAALLHPAGRALSLALAQTDADARRLSAAGVPQVVVAGNLKFDVSPPPALLQLGGQWRAAAGRPVLLAANTREGEEADLLAAWQAWRRSAGRADVLLAIVPRHPQRFDEVAALVTALGLRLVRRSSWPLAEAPPAAGLADAEVWLGDSLGELPAYYAAADVALLGGSFRPLGGHNLIEAAASGCPIVLGPSTFNFAEAAELALQAGTAWRAANWPEALQRAQAVLQAPALRAQASQAGLAFTAAHRGAAARMAQQILAWAPG